MVFGGGILGGARKIWGNPYLNSTTVLFDKTVTANKWFYNLPLWLTTSFTITCLLAFLWPLIINCGYRLIGQLFHRYLQNWLILAITDNSTDHQCNTIF